MELHKQYKEKMDAQIKEWSAQVNLLEEDFKAMSDAELRALFHRLSGKRK